METAVGITVASDDDASVKEHDENTDNKIVSSCLSIIFLISSLFSLAQFVSDLVRIAIGKLVVG